MVNEHLQNHSIIGIFIALCLALWLRQNRLKFRFRLGLPRAMEGPTPSECYFLWFLISAFRVFLMLKHFHFGNIKPPCTICHWINGINYKFSGIGYGESSIFCKSQVAYSSISQIGIIFIEIAFRFWNISLIHFCWKCILRTYQLLVSPSVVSYLIQRPILQFQTKKKANFFFQNKSNTLIHFSFKELFGRFLKFGIWKPLKIIGKSLDFFNIKRIYFFFIPIYLLGFISL